MREAQLKPQVGPPIANHEDGANKRRDRAGYWLSWIGPDGVRHVKKATARYLDGAREERRQWFRGEHPKQLADEAQRRETTFADAADRSLAYQKPRLKSPKSYVRQEGIIC